MARVISAGRNTRSRSLRAYHNIWRRVISILNKSLPAFQADSDSRLTDAVGLL